MMKLININNIPDDVYGELQEYDHNKLWNILIKFGSVKKIAMDYNIPVRNLYKYVQGIQ